MILSAEQNVAYANMPLPRKTSQVTKVKDEQNFTIRNEMWLLILWMLKWQLSRASLEPLCVWEMEKCREVKDWKYEKRGTQNFLFNSITSKFSSQNSALLEAMLPLHNLFCSHFSVAAGNTKAMQQCILTCWAVVICWHFTPASPPCTVCLC